MLSLELVNTPTHCDGNIFDLVIVESEETSKVKYKCTVGEYLPDHKYVTVKIEAKKRDSVLQIKKYTLSYCNISDEFLKQQVGNIDLKKCDTATEKACKLELELTRLLDESAPIKSRIVRQRTPKPWYNEEINHARKNYRKCVNNWTKSKKASEWSNV